MEQEILSMQTQLIGCSLMVEEAAHKVATLPKDFFKDERNRRIASIFKKLQKEKRVLNFANLVAKLEAEPDYKEMYSYIADVISSIYFPQFWKDYIKNLNKEYFVRRFKSRMEYLSSINDPDEFLKEINSLFETREYIETDESIYSLDTIQMVEEKNRITSGYKSLDYLFKGGLQKGNLVIIGGRPSMGKTAFTLNMALNIAKESLPVMFFSAEMSAVMLKERLQLMEASGYPLFFSCASPLTIDTIRETLRKEKFSIAFIDYLSYIKTEKKHSKNDEIGEILISLKSIAKDFDIPIVVVSQLSRIVEMRQDKRPILSDLRDSGNIEQDADIVIFVYRDNYYYPDYNDITSLEVRVAKNRNGLTGKRFFTFDMERQIITEGS